MPRIARIDFPGAVHHIMARGWERRPIFEDDEDRRRFRDRLGEVLLETETRCYAWAMMPNHIHLLLETGKTSISQVMRKLLTGYAVDFNLRRKRSGHLFQNRFRSLLCEKDSYFLALLRYIHRNPLKDGLVPDAAALAHFAWCGHRAVLGETQYPWHDTQAVLGHFAPQTDLARQMYQHLVECEDEPLPSAPEREQKRFRDAKGAWKMLGPGEGLPSKAVEFLAGNEEFRNRALAHVGELEPVKDASEEVEAKFRQILGRAASAGGTSPEKLIGAEKSASICLARSLAVRSLHQELGLAKAEIAKRLGISFQAVSVLLRGRSSST